MTDETTTVAELRALQGRFVDERGWSRFHSPKNLSMACAVEAAELMELFLWTDDVPGSTPGARSAPPRAEVEAEVADVALCLMSLCNVMGIDLAAAMERKVARNAERYPAEVVRGNAARYHEIQAARRGGGDGSAGDP